MTPDELRAFFRKSILLAFTIDDFKAQNYAFEYYDGREDKQSSDLTKNGWAT